MERGGKWEGGSRGREPMTDVDVWQNPTQFCKAIILQLKKNKLQRIKFYFIFTLVFGISDLFYLNLPPHFLKLAEQR